MHIIVKRWLHLYLSSAEAVKLLMLLLLGVGTLLAIGDILSPLLISLVLAFLLDSSVNKLGRLISWLPHTIVVLVVLIGALSIIAAMTIFFIPLLWEQLALLTQDMPEIFKTLQNVLTNYLGKYSELVNADIISKVLLSFKNELTSFSHFMIGITLSSIPNIILVLIYFVTIPIVIFFILDDKQIILQTVRSYFVNDKRIIEIAQEINIKLGNYVTGKVVEIFIVGAVSTFSFWFLGLNYALLLGAVVGLSVLIPYVGAAIATIPIAVIGLIQWGPGNDFTWLMLVYAAIQFVDGNILVPLLFAGTMQLHPLTIISSILLFGGLLGFWGVFFAIPLAVIIKAVIRLWPKEIYVS